MTPFYEPIIESMAISMFEIRNLKRNEVSILDKLAAELDWQTPFEEHMIGYKTDPDAYFVGTLDGEPICGIVVLNFASNSSFVGYYIVRKDKRGQGYGGKVLNHALKRANRCVGLMAELSVKEIYVKQGFKSIGMVKFAKFHVPKTGIKDPRIRPLEFHKDFEKIVQFDAQCSPEPQPKYMKNMFEFELNLLRIGYFDGDELLGFCYLSNGEYGMSCFPLEADSIEIAKSLITSAAETAGDEPLVLISPMFNPLMEEFMREYDAQEFDKMELMGKDFIIPDPSKIFSFTSCALF